MEELDKMLKQLESNLRSELSRNKAILAFNNTAIMDRPVSYSDSDYWHMKQQNFKRLAKSHLGLWNPIDSEKI